MTKMNSTNLYITTTQLILQASANDQSTWHDLYRLLPYLRNSLCCVVCGNLLIQPLTPSSGKCQHHLCKNCQNGRKKIKPACTWCKDSSTPYTENKNLRTLLQLYKKMCITLLNSEIYNHIMEQAANISTASGVERGASNLLTLIREGAAFKDDYHNNIGLSKSAYSILPCIYTNSATQTQVAQNDPAKNVLLTQNLNTNNGSTLYSVMYGGLGTKITIKRKATDENPETTATISSTKTTVPVKKETCNRTAFKKPIIKSNMKVRRGCRCGNATPTPGKLTCCGQRCPCYVDSKPCLECKCRGCRNPHLADGVKVRSHTSPVELYQPYIQVGESQLQPQHHTLQQHTLQHQQTLQQQQHVQFQHQQQLQQQQLQQQLQQQQQQQQQKLQKQQLQKQQQQLQQQLFQQQLQHLQQFNKPEPENEPDLQTESHSFLQSVNVEMEPAYTLEQLNEQLMVANIKVLDSYTKVSPNLPNAILVNDCSDNEEEEITVDA